MSVSNQLAAPRFEVGSFGDPGSVRAAPKLASPGMSRGRRRRFKKRGKGIQKEKKRALTVPVRLVSVSQRVPPAALYTHGISECANKRKESKRASNVEGEEEKERP